MRLGPEMPGAAVVSYLIRGVLVGIETPRGPFRLVVRAPKTAPLGSITDAALGHLAARGVDLREHLRELDSAYWNRDETEIKTKPLKETT